jgi:hypothetical protein
VNLSSPQQLDKIMRCILDLSDKIILEIPADLILSEAISYQRPLADVVVC